MILVHRFEMEAPFVELEHTGIITGIEDAYDKGLLTTDTIYSIHEEIDKKLECPDINMGDTISFFTDKGYKEFAEWISETCDFIQNKLGGIIKSYSMYLPESLLRYQDEYQFIVSRKDVLKWLP